MVALLNGAMTALVKGGGKVDSIDALLGDSHKTQILKDYGGEIFRYFGICERRRGAWWLSIRAASSAEFQQKRARLKESVAAKLQSLEVFFWFVCAEGYFAKEGARSKAALRALGRRYGFEEEAISAFGRLLQWLGIADFQAGRSGGLQLRTQPGISPAPANVAGASRGVSITAAEVLALKGEYQLYPSLGFFFAQKERFNEFGNWTVRSVNNRHNSADFSSAGAALRDQGGGGQGRNPDLLGYRLSGERLGIPQLEVLAVEAKPGVKQFALESVAQAEACFEFANVVYLAVAARFDDLRHRTGIVHRLTSAGIGLVTLSATALRAPDKRRHRYPRQPGVRPE